MTLEITALAVTPQRTVPTLFPPYTFCTNPGDTMKAGTRSAR